MAEVGHASLRHEGSHEVCRGRAERVALEDEVGARGSNLHSTKDLRRLVIVQLAFAQIDVILEAR